MQWKSLLQWRDLPRWMCQLHLHTGTICEHFTGNLRFYARYGRYLPDEDGWLNNSDPRAWRQFKVRVYDDDDNADDPLSSQHTWTLSHHRSQTYYARLNCYSGYVYFDYSLTEYV